MKTAISSIQLLACLFLSACATNPVEPYQASNPNDRVVLKAVFKPEAPVFVRVSVHRDRYEYYDEKFARTEWSLWQGTEKTGTSQTRLLVITFPEEHIDLEDFMPIEHTVESLFRDTSLEIGNQGTLETASGEIEYIFFRSESWPCVTIKKAWNDATDDASDAPAPIWIKNDNLIFASYCRASGPDLQRKDLDFLFDGIRPMATMWPDDMFDIVGD